MANRKLRPITPGQRFRSVADFSELTKKAPERALLEPLKNSGGRNNQGRMTVRNRGGGHKRKYRVIDFGRKRFNEKATVIALEYDPNRTARIALLEYADGTKTYIIAPDGLKVGSVVVSGPEVEPVVGNCMPLRKVPLGSVVHSIELTPGKGAQMARSAGTYAQLMAREGKYVVLKMPSSEVRRVLSECYATIGSVSNPDHINIELGKAGRNRWLGRRPRVRGVAMNPVDHPMGGGEGKASGGHPRSRNGQKAKGLRTRSPKKYSDRLIINRRKK
jgi:large subunit ribosomal protein L2